MDKKKFKLWLDDRYESAPNTVNSRLANCSTIEKYYGDLTAHYNNDNCKSIVDQLAYSKQDERDGLPSMHKIPIDGNIRNGSATLKQALNLFVEFMDETDQPDVCAPIKISEESLSPLELKFVKLIKSFKYDTENLDVAQLQIGLCDFLTANCPDFEWETEYLPSSIYRDRIDIAGISKVDNSIIAIEFDAHRADQVAKKFVSRIALFSQTPNLIYIALCYPGTKRMSRLECEKYFGYCKIIAEDLSLQKGKSRKFLGLFL